MKRILLLLVSVPGYLFCSYAATITWTGPTGSNWNNIVNWSTGTVPGANDDVVFNTSVNVEMDIIPAVTPFIYLINSLQVTGNSIVVLTRTQAGGGTRIFQIKSTSTIIPGLRIDNGSTLTMNAANAAGTLTYALDLTGAAGVTGQISGNLYFTGPATGTGGDAYLKLYTGAVNYSNLTVKGTGVIKYFPNSGNTVSAAGNYLVMESGSIYEINKNGGSLPHGNWDDNSNILITGAIANGSIIFSQSRYGNFEWNTPGMTAVTQLISTISPVTTISLNNVKITNTNGRELRLKTGMTSLPPPYDYTIRGNLDIAAAGILVIAGVNVTTAGAGARLHVMGNLSNAGTLKSDGAVGTINDLELNGIANQNISNTGIFSGPQFKFIMNNAAGATLLTPLTLPGTTTSALVLTNGKIKTAGDKLLTMLDNSNYTSGSTASFINGPMEKAGNDNTFSFPVGKGSIYAPITFNSSSAMALTDVFQAEYFRLNPQTTYGIDYESPIEHVSYVEYWNLEKTSGAVGSVNVTLAITPYSFAKQINTLYVARYNSPDMQWKNSGIALTSTGPASPPYVTGTITSAPVSQLGIFTLATDQPEAINPLPVNLILFEVKRMGVSKAWLNWELGDNSYADVKFELQRSNDGKNFTSFGVIPGSETNRFYNFYDNSLPSTITWYQLKIINVDGKITYSPVVVLLNTATAFVMTSIYPNPVYNSAIVSLTVTAASKIDFIIYDATGKIVKQWNESVNAGNNTLSIHTGNLKQGCYILGAEFGGLRSVLRFVKL